MRTIIILWLLLLCWSCQKSAVDVNFDQLELPSELSLFQQQTLAHLCGEKALPSSGDSLWVRSRWSEREKALTRAYLLAVIRSLGLEPQVQSYTFPNPNPAIDLLLEPFKGHNVFTILPATEPSEEYVVLGAHYDTGGENVPGAIDNASGMVMVLGVLREMLSQEQRSMNVIAILFDQEEEELTGSSAFARYLLAQEYQVHSVHTLDLVGWDSDQNREVELELPTAYLEDLYTRHANALNIPIYTTDINSSDHFSFIKRGFSAVGISQAYAKRDNSGKKDTPDDRYELVNFPYVLSTTELVLAAFREITQ